MCGSSGIQLFPNEPKFSKATSYVVKAAKYNITKSNTTSTYTLHGVLRFEHNPKSSMNSKRLEKMGNDKYIVKVEVPNIRTDKSQVLKSDIDNFLFYVNDSDNGSKVEKFYA